MKTEVKTVFLLGILLVLSLSIVNAAIETDTGYLKVSLKQSETTTKSLSIWGDEASSVNLEVVNLPGVSLEEESFFVNAGETKNVNIIFDSTGLDLGSYFGYLKISDSNTPTIPVIFEVESSDLLYDVDVNIPPVYLESYPGDKIIAQLKVYDLTFGTDGLGSQGVDVNYMIHDSSGELVFSASDSVIVNRDSTVSKTIKLPSDLAKGTYFLSAEARYKSSVGVSTTTFEVGSKIESWFKGTKNIFSSGSLFTVILILLVFVTGIFILLHFLKDRDRLYVSLRRCQKDELKEQRKFLLAQQKYLVKKKKVPVKEAKKRVRQKVRELKKKQKAERKKVKLSRRKKGSPGLKNKITQWKSKGYNTTLLESKVKGMNVKDMKTLMAKWKSQGYK